MAFLNKTVLGLTLFGFCLSAQVVARDITDEQYQVRMAQKEYDNATRDHEAVSQQIEQFEKRVAQLNAQLEPLKKSLPAKVDRLNKAKSNLEEKTRILDKAWEENKKNQ